MRRDKTVRVFACLFCAYACVSVKRVCVSECVAIYAFVYVSVHGCHRQLFDRVFDGRIDEWVDVSRNG